ncbi:MAG: hypothetical protein ACOY0T_31740 [Myxococcota bacterium]
MNEPKRLIISEDNELGLALAAARRQLPNSNRLALLAERLAEQGVAFPPQSLPPAPSSPAPAARWGLKFKVGIGIATIAGLGLLGVLRSRSHEGSAPNAIAAREVVTVQVTPAAPLPTVVVAPQPSAHAAERAQRIVKTEPASVSEEPKSAGVPSVATESVRQPQPTRTSRASSTQLPTAHTSPDEYVKPSGDEEPTTELDLLKQARNAVNADPLRAYALTERSRAKFPRAALAQERDFIAISALFRMGREQQARSEAALFRSHYPRSAYLPQIARMLGEP